MTARPAETGVAEDGPSVTNTMTGLATVANGWLSVDVQLRYTIRQSDDRRIGAGGRLLSAKSREGSAPFPGFLLFRGVASVVVTKGAELKGLINEFAVVPSPTGVE